MAIVPLCGIVPYCPSKRAARFACTQAGCGECIEALLREHRGLVWWMVSRQGSGKADYADLFQERRIGLWQAILHYYPERGVAFSSYACVVIVHQVWAAVRHSLKALAAPMLWDVGAFDAMLLLQVIMLYYSTRRIYD